MKKKALSLILALVFILSFAACNRGVSPAPTPATDLVEMPLRSGTPSEALPVPVTPEPTPPLYLTEDDAYTIAWISDPQYYAEQFPETYFSMTRFLARERQAMNLAYVACTGDLVNHNDEVAQWEVAVKAWDLLGDIPYGVLAGNHDMEKSRGGWELYQKYFGEARFANAPHYGGSYENNRGHFDLMDIGGTNYLFVYIGHGWDSAALQWVNETFRAYPDRVGILCVHEYFHHDGIRTEQGQTLYDKVVAANPNLYMVLCGHRYGVYCVPESFDDDGDGQAERTVLQMMMNYQAAGGVGGSGYLRLMQVREREGVIAMITYSPYLDDYNMLDGNYMWETEAGEKRYDMGPESEEFTVEIPWANKRV